MKGNATVHTTNDKYREGYDRIFGKPVPQGLNDIQERINKMLDGTWNASNLNKRWLIYAKQYKVFEKVENGVMKFEQVQDPEKWGET